VGGAGGGLAAWVVPTAADVPQADPREATTNTKNNLAKLGMLERIV
jgi:hypothetical protein